MKPANSGDDECKIAAVICIGKDALDAITGITGGVDRSRRSTPRRATAMGGVVSWAAERRGMARHADRRRRSIARPSRRWTATGSRGSYAAMVRLAIALAALFLLLAVGQAIVARTWRSCSAPSVRCRSR